MTILFWFSILFILYAYVGYPLIIGLLSVFFPKKDCPQQPTGNLSVSVIIAAKNEEKNIVKRIHNLLSLEYPCNRYEIIIVSDGSDDRTNDLVADMMMKRANIQLISYAPSRGKAYALNLGVEKAKGDIIIFADCRQYFSKDAIVALTANFADETVGCVSGELFFLNEKKKEPQVEIGTYWKYEKMIRKAESATGSVVGATGAVYAVQKKLYQPIPENTLLDDVLIPMNVVFRGYRAVYDGRAQAFDRISGSVKEEWKRKVRTLAGNWQLASLKPDLLNPRKNPIWWRFVSHKFARLLVPVFLVLALVASIHLDKLFYKVCTILQLGFYGLSVAGAIVPASRQFPLINLIHFFMVLNLAAIAGFLRWITGRCNTVWKTAAVFKEDRTQ